MLDLVIRNPEQHTGVLFNSNLSDLLTLITEGSAFILSTYSGLLHVAEMKTNRFRIDK